MKVSIITPVYNVEKYLREMLETLLCQTMHEWQCLLVNDGSTDTSLSICEEYVARDNRFEIINHSKNSGSADLARASALPFVKSDWICHIDADDGVDPDYLEKMLDRQQKTGADIVCPLLVACTEGLTGCHHTIPYNKKILDMEFSGPEACAKTIGNWQISGNGMMVRKTLYEGVERGPYLNSDEFVERQLWYKADLVVNANTKYLYRTNWDSVSRNFSKRYFGRLVVEQKVEDFVYEHYDNAKIRKDMLTSRLFTSIKITGLYVLYRNSFTREECKQINEQLQNNFCSLKREELHLYKPKQYWGFLIFGFNQFMLASYLWCKFKKIKNLW